MKMDQASLLAHDIDKFTKLGSAELTKGALEQALEAFHFAFKRSVELNEGFTERTCAFNLGAVYIALNKPEKGLEFLQKAVPPMYKRDGKSNGDLFYNFALGYQSLNNAGEMLKYLELALEEYQYEGENAAMEAEVGNKLGTLYAQFGKHPQAVRVFDITGHAYGILEEREKQVEAFSQQGLHLHLAGKTPEALAILEHCLKLCHSLQAGEGTGRIYNDLGLAFTQCGEYGKAAMCFEEALPLTSGSGEGKWRRAVIMQNLGAVYNSLGDYQRALSIHETAASLHAELGNRNSQGQCFANLAYAFVQLGEQENAGEAYLHALQAAKDTGDKHAHWQSLEGLGAIAFNRGQTDRAVLYFKQALSLVAATEKDGTAAQERIVGKLTDALQYQAHTSNGSRKPSVDIFINDEPRPPTNGSNHNNHKPRAKNPNTRRNKYDFPKMSLGVGEYDSDKDVSVSDFSDTSGSRQDLRHAADDRVPREQVQPLLHKTPSDKRRTRRPTSAASADHIYKGRGASVRQGHRRRQIGERTVPGDQPPPSKGAVSLGDLVQQSNGVQDRRARYKEMRTDSQSSGLVSDPSQGRRRRAGARGVLRSDGHDSEEEWRERLQIIHGSSSSDIESDLEDLDLGTRRLRPPPTPSPRRQLSQRSRSSKHYRSDRYSPPGQDSQRGYHSDPKPMWHRGAGVQRSETLRGRASTRSGSRSRTSETAPRPPTSDRVPSSEHPVGLERHVEHVSHHQVPSRESAGSQSVERQAVERQPETESESDSSSTDSSTESETSQDDRRTPRPPSQRASSRTPPPVPRELHSTYETPVFDRSRGASSNTTTAAMSGVNYFRGETDNHASNPSTDKYHKNDLNSTLGEDGEPLYATIKSRTVDFSRPSDDRIVRESEDSGEEPLPPPVPHRDDFTNLPKADNLHNNGLVVSGSEDSDRERLMYEYQAQLDKEKAGPSTGTVELPTRRQPKSSKTCVVM